jgi:nucleoside-diphosphate-sugar epimerase
MDLIIGNTSQLTHYFNDDKTELVSSRNFTINAEGYDNVILTFAEQRTFLNLDESEFIDVNVNYTSKLINLLSSVNKKIIVFGTSELWNNCQGPISIDTKFNYNYSPYVYSKELLSNKIAEKKLKGEWENVFILHPFNFNSPYRNKGFLFGKIFDSIINKNKITVGDININRDIIHPRLIVDQINKINNDCIVGSGGLTNVKDFIIKLFENYGMDYYDFVEENITTHSHHKDKNFWLNLDNPYTNLFNDTIIDIENYKIKNNIK